MSHFFFWGLMVAFVYSTLAFDCYTCNPKKGRDCIEQKTTCPAGIKSCSMAVFGSGQQVRVRKFCTSAGSSLYHYLLLFPGASFCQNMNVDSFEMNPPTWSVDSSPAPPSEMMPSLLCVCTSPLCNAGNFARVVENTMLNNLPRQLLAPPREEKKAAKNYVHDHPDSDLAQQLADAGF